MNIEITYMPLKLFVDETDEVFEARMNEVYTSMGYWCSKRAFELGMIYKGNSREWRKSHLIAQLALAADCDFFIETGTFLGDTLMAVSPCFKQNWSVEAQSDFFEAVSFRFSSGVRENVELLKGESPDVLQTVFSKLDQRPEKNKKSIIFLDAHFSGTIDGELSSKHVTHNSKKYGKCPLVNELDTISKHSTKDHLILIDDMRNLNPKTDAKDEWPTSLEIFTALKNINPDYQLVYAIELDMLIATTGRMNFKRMRM